jgi:hypothetical protein
MEEEEKNGGDWLRVDRGGPLPAGGGAAGRGADERPPPPVYCAAQRKEKNERL